MIEYYKFINSCKNESPKLGHNHHIIPKNMGGNDDDSNIIFLSYENHQKAHVILSEQFPENSKEYRDNKLAAQLLNSWTKNPKVLINGWSHTEEAKNKISKIKKNMYDKYGGCKNPFYGKKHTKEHKKNASEISKGNISALKKYRIFNNNFEIKIVLGLKGIKEFCYENNLPFTPLIRNKKYNSWKIHKII